MTQFNASDFRLDAPGLLWRPVARVLPRPRAEIRSWLLESGSLTLRLKQKCGGKFRVFVLEEGWARSDSPSLLQCFEPHVAGQLMWSRRVLLLGDDRPWVAAHSLIPFGSLVGPLRSLRNLNTRPLGEVLFRDTSLRRCQLEISRTGDVWGRRSLFHLHDKPLLVAEFFLPELFKES